MTDNPNDQELSFIEHLVELRSRLMKASLAVLLILVALLPFGLLTDHDPRLTPATASRRDQLKRRLAGLRPGGGGNQTRKDGAGDERVHVDGQRVAVELLGDLGERVSRHHGVELGRSRCLLGCFRRQLDVAPARHLAVELVEHVLGLVEATAVAVDQRLAQALAIDVEPRAAGELVYDLELAERVGNPAASRAVGAIAAATPMVGTGARIARERRTTVTPGR